MNLQPNDPAAEEAVIAAILNRGLDALHEAAETIRDPEMFFDRRNQAVWRATTILADRREPIDARGIEVVLGQINALDLVGGRAGLRRYYDAPSSSTTKFAERVRDLAEKRRFIRRMRELTERAAEADSMVDVVAEARLVCDDADAHSDRLFRHISEVAVDVEGEFEAGDRKGQRVLVTQGHASVDRLSGGGLGKTDLMGLAASSGTGKTGYALGVALANTLDIDPRDDWRRIPTEDPTHVLIISLEMASARLVRRAIGSMSMVSPMRFRSAGTSWLAEGEGVRVANSLRDIRQPEIYLADPRDVHGFDEIKACSHRFAAMIRKRFGPDARCLIEIDYLGLMGPSKHWRGNMSGYEIQAQKAQSIKLEICNAIEVPVIALMQLNDGPEQRAAANKDPTPMMIDLAGARAVRAHCDYLAFLYRPWKYWKKRKEMEQKLSYLRSNYAKLEQKDRTRCDDLAAMCQHVEFWYEKAREGMEQTPCNLRFMPEITTYFEASGDYRPPPEPLKKWQ